MESEFSSRFLKIQAKACARHYNVKVISCRFLSQYYNDSIFVFASYAEWLVKMNIQFLRQINLITAIALLLFCRVIYADAINIADEAEFADLSLEELTELEVFSSATLLPTEQAKAPGTVHSFNRQDFARMGIRRLDDILAFIPGFQINQYRKRHRSIWARGLLDLYNDKLVFLVDGVRRQHAYYGHFSLGDNFPLEKIEKVEIIMGPASSLYGSNAFGGIISVTTRDFSENQHIEATGEGGSNGRGKGTLFYNSESVQLFGSYLSQDAPFREDRKSFTGSETLQPLDEQFGNIFIKATPFEGLIISADYYRNQTPFVFIPPDQNAFIEEENLTLSASYKAGDLESGKIQANVYFTWDKSREYEIEQQTQSLGYTENQNAIIAGSTITGFMRFFDNHIVALGFNWMHTEAINMNFERSFHFQDGFLDLPEKGSLLLDPDVSNDDFAVYAQEVWRIIPELELTLNGRYDYFEQFGSYFNYRAALVYSPYQHHTFKLMYGTGIRAPTFREYLKVLQGTDFVAPILNPERIQSLELAYLYQWQNIKFSLSLFHNEVKDYIHVVPTPNGADEFFANSENFWRLRGVEGTLQFNLFDDLDIRLTGSYLDAQERGVGSLPYLASWTGSLLMDYNYFASHHFGFSLIYNDERQDANSYTEDEANAFLVTNIFATGDLTANFSYSFGVDNLFDNRVYDSAADFGGQYNTERTEREIWGRLTWRFDL